MQNFTLVAAAITTGLMAGLFFTFTIAVMPALNGADDRAFIDVMQRINVSILNPAFLSAFMGGLVLTAAAAIAVWRGNERSALPWILAGPALYAVMFFITSGVNVPLNNELDAAGDPSRIADLGAVRDQFEGRWVLWNAVRTVANVAAFGCIAYALIIHGRSTASAAATADPSPAVAVVVTDQLPLPQVSTRHNGVLVDGGLASS